MKSGKSSGGGCGDMAAPFAFSTLCDSGRRDSARAGVISPAPEADKSAGSSSSPANHEYIKINVFMPVGLPKPGALDNGLRFRYGSMVAPLRALTFRKKIPNCILRNTQETICKVRYLISAVQYRSVMKPKTGSWRWRTQKPGARFWSSIANEERSILKSQIWRLICGKFYSCCR